MADGPGASVAAGHALQARRADEVAAYSGGAGRVQGALKGCLRMTESVYYVCMKARDVLRLLKSDGWFEVRTHGSHILLKHATRPGAVTVPMHGAKDIKLPTLISIERQSGLKLRSK